MVFEHPKNAASWEEECMQELKSMEGMIKTECDMCAFGMQVTPEGLNKKPTGILTNSPEIAAAVSKTCTKDHFHVPLLGGLAH